MSQVRSNFMSGEYYYKIAHDNNYLLETLLKLGAPLNYINITIICKREHLSLQYKSLRGMNNRRGYKQLIAFIQMQKNKSGVPYLGRPTKPNFIKGVSNYDKKLEFFYVYCDHY